MSKTPASATGGVVPLTIGGRMVLTREREIGMSDEERKWRAQWVKDQHLTAREPVHVPELQRSLLNPIRRFYRFPLDYLQACFEPKYPMPAKVARFVMGKTLMVIYFGFCASYYLQYNSHTWKDRHGWIIRKNRPTVLPGDPGYPKLSEKSKPSDYHQQGFQDIDLHFGKEGLR